MNKDILSKAYRLISLSRFMSKLFEKEKNTTSKYVHATSKGHEIIQIAMGLQLCNYDYLYPYYRDDSILLSIGLQPYDLILQLLAKSKDPFSGGKTYYSHPSLNDKNLPKIPHQSSATGMQAIPATGAAMGLLYKEKVGLSSNHKPIVVCSLGDASCTEGEVSEAFQMAVLKKLPIIYLVQDNEWDISAKAEETRSQDISFYSKGFKGLHSFSIDGTNFEESYLTVKKALEITRNRVGPVMIHAKVPLLNHHTSGVRMEWYRDDIEEHLLRDPYPKLKQLLLENNFTEERLLAISNQSETLVNQHYKDALKEKEPDVDELYQHIFAPTKVIEENGNRSPSDKEPTVMVDSALFAIREILASDKDVYYMVKTLELD